jgi:hypothetical protein
LLERAPDEGEGSASPENPFSVLSQHVRKMVSNPINDLGSNILGGIVKEAQGNLALNTFCFNSSTMFRARSILNPSTRLRVTIKDEVTGRQFGFFVRLLTHSI